MKKQNMTYFIGALACCVLELIVSIVAFVSGHPIIGLIALVACAACGVIAWKVYASAGVKKTDNLLAEKDLADVKASQRVVKVVVQILLYAFLGIMALIVLFPFYFMLISSVKTVEEYKLSVPTLFPRVFDWHNYIEVFQNEDLELATLFGNTVFVGIVSTLLSLVITVLSAFAFARLEFKGKNALFAALLATMMIPGELFTITNYQTIHDFLGLNTLGQKLGSDFLMSMGNWTNTYTVLIVPFLVSVFYIYLLRQNFMQIPNELYLAAKVDGTSDLKYLWKVMIPLALPTLISITILKMMGAWNSYMWPNLVTKVTKEKNLQLITNGLRNAFTDAAGVTDIPAQMAAVALVSLPLFLVFIFLRKYIMKGVSRSGIKG